MNCDGVARWYRWLEYAGFGRALERRRLEFLPEMAAARCALVLGDGDGRFLAALLAANGEVRVDNVEQSAAMLALATRRAAAAGGERVHFHQADARGWRPPAEAAYDLIATHFFLDCFEQAEVEALVERLARFAAPGASWIVSEFHKPASGFPAWRAAVWIGCLYTFFCWTTGLTVRRLPNHRAALEKHGFHRERAVTSQAGLLISEWYRSA